MDKISFDKNIVYIDKEFKDTEEFFEFAAKELEGEYVEESFLAAIKEREVFFPTGLPIEPWGIAIPHCDSKHILKPFISVFRLKKPVQFVEMGTDDRRLNISIIFLLGFFQHNGSQIELLQILMSKFTDKAYVEGLMAAKNKDELTDFLNKNI